MGVNGLKLNDWRQCPAPADMMGAVTGVSRPEFIICSASCSSWVFEQGISKLALNCELTNFTHGRQLCHARRFALPVIIVASIVHECYQLVHLPLVLRVIVMRSYFHYYKKQKHSIYNIEFEQYLHQLGLNCQTSRI